MKKRLQLILLWMAFAGLSGCLGSSNDPAPQVYTTIAITHVAPDCPGLDVFLDDVSLGGSALVFKNYSGYFFTDPGARNMKFKSAIDGAVLINSSLTFEQFKAYSVFVITAATHSFDTWVVEDYGTLSSMSKFMARFANFSPDAPRATLNLVEDNVLISGKSFKEISVFTEMDPKTYTLEVRAEDDGHLILSKQFTPVAGAFYTISLIGFQTPPGGNPNTLNLLIIKSQ